MSLSKLKALLATFACCIAASTSASIFDGDRIVEDLELSGFARVIGGYLDTDDATFKGYDSDFNFKPDSLLGLQSVYTPIDELSITAQVIAHANDYDDNDHLHLEWLYLTYRPIESLQVKVGKLRTPFFTLSDVMDVGYAYPWVTPPQQVYNAYLFETFEGIDFIYRYGNAVFESSIEVYAGRYDGDINLAGQETDFSVRNMRGIIGKIQFDNLEFRVSRYAADVEFKDGPLPQLKNTLELFGFSQSAHSLRTTGRADVSQVGLIYDNINYFARTEWVNIRTDLEIAPKVESYYLTLGYNFSPFILHLTYDSGKNDLGRQEQEIPFGVNPLLDGLAFGYDSVFNSITQDNLKSWTLGLRWDFRKNLAFKTEATKLKANTGEEGFFTVIDDTNFDRNANLYLIGLEWVF